MRERAGIGMLVLAAAFALPPALSTIGCERHGSSRAPAASDDATDQLTQRLLADLRIGDLDGVYALCNPELASELEARGAAELAVITQTLDWLGPVESLEHTSEAAVADGVRREYAVRFGRGQIDLSLIAVGGKVEGFEFDPAQWQLSVDRAAEAAAGSLRVAQFRYLDRNNQPLTGPLDPANITYEIALEGLEAVLREHHVIVAKTVHDAAGNEVYRQPEDDDIRFPQAEAGSGGGRITGSVAVPGPGQYEIVFEIRDLVGVQNMTHRASFVIE